MVPVEMNSSSPSPAAPLRVGDGRGTPGGLAHEESPGGKGTSRVSPQINN